MMSAMAESGMTCVPRALRWETVTSVGRMMPWSSDARCFGGRSDSAGSVVAQSCGKHCGKFIGVGGGTSLGGAGAANPVGTGHFD